MKRPAETEKVIELGSKKRVTVRRFNGVNLVDIREFYLDKNSGEMKPGKKGISLSAEVWRKVVESRVEIDAALAELGDKRAKLGGPDGESVDGDNGDDDGGSVEAKTSNTTGNEDLDKVSASSTGTTVKTEHS